MKSFFALFQILFYSFLSFSQDLPDFNFEEKEKKTIDVKYNFGIGAGVRFFNKFNITPFIDYIPGYGTSLGNGDIKNYPHFSNISITNRISFDEKINFYANIEYDINTIRVVPQINNPDEEVFKLNESEFSFGISLSYNFHKKLALESGVLFYPQIDFLEQSQRYYSEVYSGLNYSQSQSIYTFKNDFGVQTSLRFLLNKNNNLNIRYVFVNYGIRDKYRVDYTTTSASGWVTQQSDAATNYFYSKGNIQLIYTYFF